MQENATSKPSALKSLITEGESIWAKNHKTNAFTSTPLGQPNPPENVILKQVPDTDCIWADSNGDIWNSYGGAWRKLTGGVNIGGYRVVSFKKHGKHLSSGVHRLVAAAFHGPCPEGMECMHLNDTPSDNRPENLKWGTREENNKNKNYPERYNQGLTPEHREEMKRLKSEGWSYTRIANHFGIRYHQVQLFMSGKTYGNKPKRRYSKGLIQACLNAAQYLESISDPDNMIEKANQSIARGLRRKAEEIEKRSKT